MVVLTHSISPPPGGCHSSMLLSKQGLFICKGSVPTACNSQTEGLLHRLLLLLLLLFRLDMCIQGGTSVSKLGLPYSLSPLFQENHGHVISFLFYIHSLDNIQYGLCGLARIHSGLVLAPVIIHSIHVPIKIHIEQ